MIESFTNVIKIVQEDNHWKKSVDSYKKDHRTKKKCLKIKYITIKKFSVENKVVKMLIEVKKNK